MIDRCVIFDCHHPKHFLALRQLGVRCRLNGIRPIWTMRDKDVLLNLVKGTGDEFHVLTRSQKGLVRLFGELIVYDLKLAGLARKLRPRVLMGNSVSIAHVGKALGIPVLLINDDDARANPQYPYLGYPFATRIITPECITEDYGRRHRKYPGLHELAYLHPRVFTPDPSIRDDLNAAPGERIFLIRSVALAASHDIGAKGLSKWIIRHLIDMLREKGKVFISAESRLDDEFAKYRLPAPASRIHDVLAACDMLIGDSQTMAAEAAVLGTPSIRMNSFVNRIAYLTELENRFGLTYGFAPDQVKQMFEGVEFLLTLKNAKQIWENKRSIMLEKWIDPTDVFWEELDRYL